MPESVAEISSLFRVGYALPARKIEAFMVESFISYARKQGIEFIPIDISKPLTHQGPFHCILHKLYDHAWNLNLEDYTANHRSTTIIDPPSAIHRLNNRLTMLEPVTQLNIPNLTIPHQVVIQDLESLNSVRDLTFPVIGKPLLADGTTKAHNMSLVFNQEGLTKLELEPPMVLQRFVNHGGVIFKVYVAGEYVKCVKRSSLPDVSMGKDSGGVLSFSQISGSVMGGDTDDAGEKIKMPEPEFVVEVAKRLREALRLRLFNFDMMRNDESDGYLVVDINYFPGYEKLPSYESVMTDFFLSVKKSREQNDYEIAKLEAEADETQV